MDWFGELGGLGTLSASGLLALVVLFIMRGALVPRRTVDDIKEDRDRWRSAAEESREQVTLLLSVGHHAERLLRETNPDEEDAW